MPHPTSASTPRPAPSAEAPRLRIQLGTRRRPLGAAYPAERRRALARFLHRSLGDYGDPVDAIERCVRYACAEDDRFGGTIVEAFGEDGERLGAAVTNRTGMGGYIPEEILVYIAVAPGARGRGVGSALLDAVIERAAGDLALHVDPENPAARLYERAGFRHAYNEMRRSG